MKLKVLYIIDTLNVAGAEQSLSEITTEFTKVQPVFVHVYPGEILKPYLINKGIRVYSLNIKSKYGFNEAKAKLKNIYMQESPDIVHSTLYRADIIARKMKKLFPKIPLVGSFVNNSYTPLRYLNKSMFMRFKLWLAYQVDYSSAKNVDFFISNSETIKNSEGGSLKIPNEKIKVIYRGRNPHRFKNITPEESKNFKELLGLKDAKILVNVSRLIERKGQLDIIKVMPAILKEHPNTVLLIAGDGSFRNNLENEIAKLGLEKYVQLLGSYSDIPELLSIADIFLYPSYAEGLPGALIEAMMSSCIIINSDIGENLECVNDSNSLSFPVGNLEVLKRLIIEVLNCPERYHYLKANANKAAINKFSIRKIANEYEQTYINLINTNLRK